MKIWNFSRMMMLSSLIGLVAVSCGPDPVTPPGPDAGLIDANITANRTLTDRVPGPGVDYTIKGEISVKNSAVLTVEPGVTIQFEQDAYLLMEDMGALHAVGTAASPILFTGKQATKGFWKGLLFVKSNNTQNELTYCTVEYGGGSNYLYEEGNVVLGSDDYGLARLKLNNTTLRNSSSMGFYISSESYLDAFANCTITGNNNAAVRVEAQNSDLLNASNDYSGNTENYVIVDGAQFGGENIQRNMTWVRLNVPYAIKHEVQIEKTLTIASGTQILGLSDAGFYVNGEGAKVGKLLVNGTAANPVIMNGEQETKGFWKGIFLWGGEATLNYCTINNAGAYSTFDFTSVKAAIVAESYYDQVSKLTVNNSSIINSGFYGVAIDSDPDAGSNGVSSSYTKMNVTYNGNTNGNEYNY